MTGVLATIKGLPPASAANYAFGLFQVIVTVVVLLTCEIAQRVPRYEDERLIKIQWMTAHMMCAGMLFQGALISNLPNHGLITHIPGIREILNRFVSDARMMWFMFACLSAAYFLMASDYHVVHEWPLAASLGSRGRKVYALRYLEWSV
eukprot:CAMPEP_0195059418 /NCGR_PEP_ID=MMETSP0448-20130528/6920_1 /TAXON_ID=66468 /ORGANISM="Heterocapsa triquestra, Strain CCMP 448" /LENGTH=148 /DNA_ID=CAMNT_0040089691 /DNA_START=175 /DNA_END=617 /DNA_ORIENTATION=+